MTLTELKTAVLQELNVLATGESPVDGDATIVADKYAGLYEMLLTEGLISWASTEDVPTFAEMPITWMVAYLSVGEFGVPAQKRQELQLKGALNLSPKLGGPSLAEQQLRRQLAANFVYAPQATEYF